MSVTDIEHRAEHWQPVDIILSSQHTLENPWTLELPNGSIAAGTRQGSHVKGGGTRPNTNEDRLILQIPTPDTILLALLDSHLHSKAGDAAAEVFRPYLKTALMQPDRAQSLSVMRLIHFEIQRALRDKLEIENPKSSKLKAGICSLIALIAGDQIPNGYVTGDSQVVIIRKGKVIFMNKVKHKNEDKSQPENYIGVKDHELGTPEPLIEDENDPISLEPGDIVIAGTDGLFHLISKPEAFAQHLLKQGLTDPRAILEFINQGVEYQHNRKYETDDITAVIYVHRPDQKPLTNDS